MWKTVFIVVGAKNGMCYSRISMWNNRQDAEKALETEIRENDCGYDKYWIVTDIISENTFEAIFQGSNKSSRVYAGY